MKNDRYGQYEQVNGGVVNDLNDKLDKAIELLTECSSELFIQESNIVLEQKVDKFLNENIPKIEVEVKDNLSGLNDLSVEVAECPGDCEGCNKELPSSLKKQAD